MCGGPNSFATVAAIAAFTKGADWLDCSGICGGRTETAESRIGDESMKKQIVSVLLGVLLILAACGMEQASDNSTTPAGNSDLTAESDVATESADEISESPDVDTETEDEEMSAIELKINGESFTARLYDNETTRALLEQLPMTLSMSELNGNEKYCYLSDSLPTDAEVPDRIHSGDLMLFGSGCIVLFYKDFSTSYSYTPLGTLEDADGLADVLGRGSVEIEFCIK